MDHSSEDCDDFVKLVSRFEIVSPFGKWLQPTIVIEGDKKFLRVAKYDRGFIVFCGCGSLRFGQSGTAANVRKLDELIDLRNKASQEAVEMVLRETLAPGEKIRKVRKEDKDLLDKAYVPVEFPGFTHDGISHGPITVNCLWALKGRELHVEFSQETLLYLRVMVQHEKAEGNTGRTRAVPKSPKARAKRKVRKASPKQQGLKRPS